MLGGPLLLVVFGATLAAVAIFHRRALECALAGLAAIVLLRLATPPFEVWHDLGDEWVKLANLAGLLLGFPLLADHLEQSNIMARLPRVLPRGTAGCFALLAIVWLLSGVLDNIAAAMIGATAARRLFKNGVHLGYLAAIVAAANGGGAGSVLGDTTTTMMWIDGVSPVDLSPAYIGAFTALVVSGFFAARQQQARSPLDLGTGDGAPMRMDRARLLIVAAALMAMLATNLIPRGAVRDRTESVPLLAIALWLALLAGARVRAPNWRLIPSTARAALFLLALVISGALMPARSLPAPSAWSVLALGLLSSVFDNIPLTKLALDHGGYDWALLAYAVGLGGSMLWFGSSAGVAVAGQFPEMRPLRSWLRNAWHVPVGFAMGFATMVAVRGWRP